MPGQYRRSKWQFYAAVSMMNAPLCATPDAAQQPAQRHVICLPGLLKRTSNKPKAGSAVY